METNKVAITEYDKLTVDEKIDNSEKILNSVENDLVKFNNKFSQLKKHLIANLSLMIIFAFLFWPISIMFILSSAIIYILMLRLNNKIIFWKVMKDMSVLEKQELLKQKYH